MSGIHGDARPWVHPTHLWNPPCRPQCCHQRLEQGSPEVETWTFFSNSLWYVFWPPLKDQHGECNPVRSTHTGCWSLVFWLDEEEVWWTDLLYFCSYRIFEFRATEEDAMMKHYILTHPQHFPEPKKVATWPNIINICLLTQYNLHIFPQVKYLDKLEPWVPVRW